MLQRRVDYRREYEGQRVGAEGLPQGGEVQGAEGEDGGEGVHEEGVEEVAQGDGKQVGEEEGEGLGVGLQKHVERLQKGVEPLVEH